MQYLSDYRVHKLQGLVSVPIVHFIIIYYTIMQLLQIDNYYL